MTSLLGWRPSLLDRRPLLLGWRPSLVGWMPSLLDRRPSLLGRRSSLVGWRPSLEVGGHHILFNVLRSQVVAIGTFHPSHWSKAYCSANKKQESRTLVTPSFVPKKGLSYCGTQCFLAPKQSKTYQKSPHGSASSL